MSLRDFWISVRTALGCVRPMILRPYRAEPRPIQLDLWLTPRTVADFNEQDFSFLEPEQAEQLREAVEAFRAFASQVSGDRPATRHDREKGLPLLERIVELLRFDRYADPDALCVGSRIDQHLLGRLPRWVRSLWYETGTDAQGNPALWIWVEAENSALRDNVLPENTQGVQTLRRAA